MSTVTTSVLDRPGAGGTTSPGDDLCHLYCCDENVAMCGLDISGHEDNPDSEEPECPLCAYVDDAGLPCPVPGCRGDEDDDDD